MLRALLATFVVNTPGDAVDANPNVTSLRQAIELGNFRTPDAIRFGPVVTPVNTLGIRRIMFAVDEIDVVVARKCAHGADHWRNAV